MEKILIDSTAFPKKPVGAGVYISRLIKEILLCNTQFDIKIVVHDDDIEEFFITEKYHKNFILQKDLGRGFRIISEQIYFPKLLELNQINLYHGLHYSMPIKKNKNVKFITTIHDLSFFTVPKKHNIFKKFFFKFFIEYSSKQSDHLIAVSNNTKNDLIKLLNVNPDKISTTHLGVDDSFSIINNPEKKGLIKSKYNLPDNFVLYVGLIEPRKNLSSLIKAFARVKNAQKINENIHLVLAGRWGWESKELLSLISESNISDKVHFPGYINQEDLPILYNMAKIFVYPSYYEGFGLPVLEAMACGTPVITSNISSMPEFVGDSGILIDPNNVLELEKRICDLLLKDDLREELRRKGLAKAKEYTWRNTALKTLEVYRRVLKGE